MRDSKGFNRRDRTELRASLENGLEQGGYSSVFKYASRS